MFEARKIFRPSAGLVVAALLLASIVAFELRGSAATSAAQPCQYSATFTPRALGGTPRAGAEVTVVETNTTTRTNALGRFSVSIPGEGVWTIRVTYPGITPAIIRLEAGPNCTVRNTTESGGLPLTASTPPPPPPPASNAASSPASAASAQVAGGRYSGRHAGGGLVSFEVSADGMSVTGISVTGGPCGAASMRDPSVPITGDTFSGLLTALYLDGTGEGRFDGRFLEGGRAEGTLQVISRTAGRGFCDSGTMTWTASAPVPRATPSPTPTPTPTPAPTPTPTPSPEPSTPPSGEILIADSFDGSNSGILPQSSSAENERGYDAGEYVIRIFDPAAVGVTASIPDVSGDATLAVTARLEGETDGRTITLVCRRTEAGQYRLLVDPHAGSFQLSRVDGEAESSLLDEPSSAIRPGNEPNRLELSCLGATIAVRINEMSVGAVEDSTHTTGELAIGAGSYGDRPLPLEARFDDLLVSRPSDAASAPPADATEPPVESESAPPPPTAEEPPPPPTPTPRPAPPAGARSPGSVRVLVGQSDSSACYRIGQQDGEQDRAAGATIATPQVTRLPGTEPRGSGDVFVFDSRAGTFVERYQSSRLVAAVGIGDGTPIACGTAYLNGYTGGPPP